ncbi:MAG TPA: hypothetical protein VF952_02445 [Chloroflexia bacterium]|jgi:hypothetical protein
MSNTHTLEAALFRLKAGTDEEAFLMASDGTMTALKGYSGFIRREVLKSDDGQWLDLIYWHSLEEAMSAAEQIISDPTCHPFLEMLDMGSITMLHLQPVRTY